MFKQISCVYYSTITFHLGYVYIMETSKITGSSWDHFYSDICFIPLWFSRKEKPVFFLLFHYCNASECFVNCLSQNLLFHIAVMRTRKLSWQHFYVVFFFFYNKNDRACS